MSDQYIVYGMANCRYCSMAVSLLEKHNMEFVYHDVMIDLEQRKLLLKKVPMATTLPQILCNGTPIGGYTELSESISS